MEIVIFSSYGGKAQDKRTNILEHGCECMKLLLSSVFLHSLLCFLNQGDS